MIFHRYADLFEICWPVFRPWLWLQLSILCAQKAEDGRERLIMGTWWGKVYVLAIGDAPDAPPNAPITPFRGSSSAHFTALFAAKFPGDLPGLSAWTKRNKASLSYLISLAPARADRTTLRPRQDKTHIFAPG